MNIGTDPEGPAAQQVDAVIVTIAETHEQSTNNTVTVPTSVSSSQLSYADVTSHTTTNANSGYRQQPQNSKSSDYHVYVGKLKENMSKKAVLDHLHDIGVSHVSDVIQLQRKTGGQTSFCVSRRHST